MAASEIKWIRTTEALKDMFDLLSCSKCNQTATFPIKYTKCGHFFCKSCIGASSRCPKCTCQVQAKEVQSDHTLANLIRCCKSVSEVVDESTIDKCDEANRTTKHEESAEPSRKLVITPPVPKNINKRNSKGETQLHEACNKGKVEVVRHLLEVGANPNTKDNAGWTPLQEATDFGYYEICSLLLKAGALPNTPGPDNKTALHQAVENSRLEEAQLLIKYNADKNACDITGKRPIDYASGEMRQILTEEEPEEDLANRTVETGLDQSFVRQEALVLAVNLSSESQMLLSEMIIKHKIKSTATFRSGVSHVIVEVNEKNVATLNYDILLAILHGKWLLNTQWIRLGLETTVLDEIELDVFEVMGTKGVPNSNTPKHSRENTQKQNPRLFDGCCFYFALNNSTKYTVESIEFTKATLAKLVTEGEGKVLSRDPHPEKIQPAQKVVPFHVSRDPDHPLHRCSHYIIYAPGKEEPDIIYRMPHMKSLPILWLIESIERFQLLDPSFLGLNV